MKAIMYHYVRRENASLPYFRYLHMDDFCNQLDYFSQEYVFVSKDAFVQAIHEKKAIPNGIVLTFDDGLKDHLSVAQELKQRGLWGIFYIPTGSYKNNKLLDVHRIHMLLGTFGGEKILNYLLENIDENALSYDHINEFHTLTYARQTNDISTQKCKRILNYLISDKIRTQVLDKMMTLFFGNENDIVNDFYLSETDIKTMHQDGMVIGSHSITHPVFSKLNNNEQKREISQSFDFIENIVKKLEPKTFCYPYGGFHSFTSYTEECLKQEKCLFSFNVEQRDIEQNDLLNRPQALPRYDCNQFPHGSASMGNVRP